MKVRQELPGTEEVREKDICNRGNSRGTKSEGRQIIAQGRGNISKGRETLLGNTGMANSHPQRSGGKLEV